MRWIWGIKLYLSADPSGIVILLIGLMKGSGVILHNEQRENKSEQC